MAKLLKEFEPGHGFSQEDWDEVSDNPELTDEQIVRTASAITQCLS